MRYFVVVLAVFGLLHLPVLANWGWLVSPADRASLALAIGIFLSGIHHAVFANHYADLLPERMPYRTRQVYLSAILRMVFGLGLLFISTRLVATIGTLVLLCLVLPINIRMAKQGNATGQFIAARWFLWLRLVVHVSWIVWCGWCLVL